MKNEYPEAHLYGRVARESDKIQKIPEWSNKEPIKTSFMCRVFGHKHVTYEGFNKHPELKRTIPGYGWDTRAVIHNSCVRCGHYDKEWISKKSLWARFLIFLGFRCRCGRPVSDRDTARKCVCGRRNGF